MEIWKDINNYEGLYQISNEGNVKSLDKSYNVGYGGIKHQEEIILKPTYVGNGYLHVCLCKNGNKEYKRIHRLVAEAFIPNPNGYPTVNHKDENPENNKVENLEWCTQLDNVRHSSEHMKHKKGITHSNTGEKYITYSKGKYRVIIDRKEYP